MSIKTLFTKSVLLIPFIGLSGCNNYKVLDEGYWFAAGYGKIYDFHLDGQIRTIREYQITDQTCFMSFVEDESTFDQKYRVELIDSGRKIEINWRGENIVPGIIYTRLETLPEYCQDTQIELKGHADYVFDARRDFDIFWETFNDYYGNFAINDTDWQQIYDEAQQQLPLVSNEVELFELFANSIEPLKSSHNRLYRGDLSEGIEKLILEKDPIEYVSELKLDYINLIVNEYLIANNLSRPLANLPEDTREALVGYIDQQVNNMLMTVGSYASQGEVHSDDQHGHIKWFSTDTNIGYLNIARMVEFGGSLVDITNDVAGVEKIMDTVLSDLQDTDGLIIDVRANFGGQDEVAMAIARRFVNTQHHAYSKQARHNNERTPLVDVYLEPTSGYKYSKPIVLLVSQSTHSAAEVFALALRDLPYITLVGEPTTGSLSSILFKRVSSDIAFGLSNEIYLTPNGEWFEHQGIPVDCFQPFASAEQRDAGRDLGMEAALNILQNGGLCESDG